MSRSRTLVDFRVYEKEPLIRFITSWNRMSPVNLTVGFYLAITIPMCLWAASSSPPEDENLVYVSFFDNISWSVSIIFIFPFVAGLTLRFYDEIPRLFSYLLEELVKNGNDMELEKYGNWLNNRFNDRLSASIFFLISLILNAVYVYQILKVGDLGWITDGELFISIPGIRHGLSWFGVYGMIIQVVLIYWVFNLVWRGFVLSRALYELFEKRKFSIIIEPLHPDGVCGLRSIGDLTTILSTILFMLGIYVSLKVIDKIIIQNSSIFEDIGNPIMLVSYAIMAPLLFFLPLGAAHGKMVEAKICFLQPISKRCTKMITDIGEINPDDRDLVSPQSLNDLIKIKDDLNKRIHVWPFDFRSLKSFFGAIVVPFVPVLLPFFTEWILGK